MEHYRSCAGYVRRGPNGGSLETDIASLSFNPYMFFSGWPQNDLLSLLKPGKRLTSGVFWQIGSDIEGFHFNAPHSKEATTQPSSHSGRCLAYSALSRETDVHTCFCTQMSKISQDKVFAWALMAVILCQTFGLKRSYRVFYYFALDHSKRIAWHT